MVEVLDKCAKSYISQYIVCHKHDTIRNLIRAILPHDSGQFKRQLDLVMYDIIGFSCEVKQFLEVLVEWGVNYTALSPVFSV